MSKTFLHGTTIVKFCSCAFAKHLKSYSFYYIHPYIHLYICIIHKTFRFYAFNFNNTSLFCAILRKLGYTKLTSIWLFFELMKRMESVNLRVHKRLMLLFFPAFYTCNSCILCAEIQFMVAGKKRNKKGSTFLTLNGNKKRKITHYLCYSLALGAKMKYRISEIDEFSLQVFLFFLCCKLFFLLLLLLLLPS